MTNKKLQTSDKNVVIGNNKLVILRSFRGILVSNLLIFSGYLLKIKNMGNR